MSKARFKKMVNRQVNKFAYQWLLNIARVQSKCQKIIDSLKGETLHMQEYLKSSELSKCEQQLLFAVRCRSYYVKSNYKSQFKSDMTCRSCFDPMSYEDVDHIVKSCLKFKDLIGDEKLSFNDVYGSLQDQIKFWWELDRVSSLCCNDSNSDKILPNKVHFCIVYCSLCNPIRTSPLFYEHIYQGGGDLTPL